MNRVDVAPYPPDETWTLQVDTLITAIGEQQDGEALAAMGIPLNDRGWPEVNADGESGWLMYS